MRQTKVLAIGKNVREARLNVWKNAYLYDILEVGRAKTVQKPLNGLNGLFEFSAMQGNGLEGGF